MVTWCLIMTLRVIYFLNKALRYYKSIIWEKFENYIQFSLLNNFFIEFPLLFFIHRNTARSFNDIWGISLFSDQRELPNVWSLHVKIEAQLSPCIIIYLIVVILYFNSHWFWPKFTEIMMWITKGELQPPIWVSKKKENDASWHDKKFLLWEIIIGADKF